MTPLERQLDRLERGVLLRNGIIPDDNPPAQIAALLAAIGKWDEALHPRGRDGRFIEKFGFLQGTFNWMPDSGDSTNPMGGGSSKKVSRAKVVGFSSGNGATADDPWVKVEYEGPDPELQGQVGFARASEVSQAAGTKARLDAPEGQSNGEEDPRIAELRARVHAIDEEIAKIDSGEALRERMAEYDAAQAGDDDPTLGPDALDDRLDAIDPGDDTGGSALDRWYDAIGAAQSDTFGREEAKDLSEDELVDAIAELEERLEEGNPGMSGRSDLRVLQAELSRRSSGDDEDLDVIDPDDPRYDLNVPDDSGVRTPSGPPTPREAQQAEAILGPERVADITDGAGLSGATPEQLQQIVDEAAEIGDDQLEFDAPEASPAGPDPEVVEQVTAQNPNIDADPKGDADQVRAYMAQAIAQRGLDTEDASIRSRQLDQIYSDLGFGTALDTDSLYKVDGVWTEERQALHEEMWQELISQIEAAGIPKERDALALGGLPGAGKSFTLKPGEVASEFGVVSWEPGPGEAPPAGATHVSINPDIIKEVLIAKGALPPGTPPEMKPMEQVHFIHEESSELSKLFVSMLADEGYNIVLDNTMERPDGMIKRMKPLAEAGYSFRGLFVDIPVAESRESARKRYERAMKSEMGGRFVPSGVQRDEPSTNGRLSPNRDAFDILAGVDADGNPGGPSWFTDFMVVDNTGVAGDPPKPKKEVVLRSTGDGSLASVHNPVDTMSEAEITDTGEIIPEGDWRNQEELA